MKKVFWKDRDGKKILVDEMSEEYAKNALKMLIRKNNKLAERMYSVGQVNLFLALRV